MKTILLLCFSLFCSLAFAQNHATPNTKCQLEVREILEAQSFDIDEPISEKARYIIFEIYEELNLIYELDPLDPKRAEHIQKFKVALEKANAINLNLAMFQEDIDYVSSLTP